MSAAVTPPALGPCRLCEVPSWSADAAGPVHRCCARTEADGLGRCIACGESKAARRRKRGGA